MYNMKFDLTNKPNSIYLKDKSDVVICIEDDDTEIEMKITYKQFEGLCDEHKGYVGEPTYKSLEDKIEKLEIENERLNNLIEQYEEHNDARMEKYFESEFY